jgi:hypothetical protein
MLKFVAKAPLECEITNEGKGSSLLHHFSYQWVKKIASLRSYVSALHVLASVLVPC